MKKVLIVCNNLKIGGIQKSLINLLNEIHNDYDITVFLFSSKNEYKDKIPANVRIIYGNSFIRLLAMTKQECYKTGLFCYLVREAFALFSRFFTAALPIQIVARSQKIREKFDVSVSFLNNVSPKAFVGGCNEFVLYGTKADKKVCIFHYSFEKGIVDTPYNTKIMSKFDYIAGCSDGCTRSMLEVRPDFKNKAISLHNCQNYSKIKKMADEFVPEFDKGKFNIVCVVRLSEEKGIFRMADVIKRLCELNYEFVYHMVGGGHLEKKFIDYINEKNLENVIIMHGPKPNPYPYMKAADLVAVPSIGEGAPMVYSEAQCIGTPVLTTDTVSAYDMVGNYGFVCENSEEGIFTKLKFILDNKDELEKKRELLKNAEFDNKRAISDFKHMVEM